MKKVAVCILCFFIACNTDRRPPADIAKDFLLYMQQRNYSSAKKLATPQSKNLIEGLAVPNQNLFPITEKDTYKITAVNTRNDSCFVRVHIDGKAYPMQLLLLKLGSSWKVAYDLQTIIEMPS